MEAQTAIMIVGYIITAFAAIVFIPQVYEVWKTKKTDGLNPVSYIAYATGISLWGVFGAFTGDGPNYAVNIFTLLSSMMLFYYIFKNNNNFKIFIMYSAYAAFITILASVLLATRLTEVWGPPVKATKEADQPIYYRTISYIISITASVTTSLAFFPQTVRSIQTKSVKVNLGFMLLVWSTQLSWAVYWILNVTLLGVGFNEWLMGFISATFASGTQAVLLVYRIKFRHLPQNQPKKL